MSQPTKRQKLSQEDFKEKASDDAASDDGGTKWRTLEHHGMKFPNPYQPLPKGVQVKVKATKKAVEMPQEVEEMACFWAEAENTEFGEKQKVKENFWNDFGKKIDKAIGIKGLDELDFTDVRNYLEKVKEEKKNRPTEVKKAEADEQQKLNASYQVCLIDGDPEKVANYNIEPPGLFRGRGEHPHAGRIKSRIVPEYVIINTGYDDPIPPCPISGHAWKKVSNNQSASWLCHFKDEKNTYSKSKKYLFLAAESKLKGLSDKQKYERARRLKNIIAQVRENYNEKMKSDSLEANQLGVATYLIDKLALRVGNEKGEDEADTVGCCSLRVEHIKLEEPNKVTFDFLGKDSMRYLNTIEVEPLVFNNMKKFIIKRGPAGDVKKDSKEDLFDLINASKLNDHLKTHMSDLSAKVFRTYNASITLQKQLEEHAEAKKMKNDTAVDSKVNFYSECNREVALLCNHKKAESKGLKDQLERIETVIAEKQKEMKEIQANKKKIKDGKPTNSKIKLPATAEACEARVKKLQEQITAEELKLKNKKDNAEVALGTSKINYMDPRITISWCKRREVPIEKVFSKTLRSKFAWAMDNEPEWHF